MSSWPIWVVRKVRGYVIFEQDDFLEHISKQKHACSCPRYIRLSCLLRGWSWCFSSRLKSNDMCTDFSHFFFTQDEQRINLDNNQSIKCYSWRKYCRFSMIEKDENDPVLPEVHAYRPSTAARCTYAWWRKKLIVQSRPDHKGGACKNRPELLFLAKSDNRISEEIQLYLDHLVFLTLFWLCSLVWAAWPNFARHQLWPGWGVGAYKMYIDNYDVHERLSFPARLSSSCARHVRNRRPYRLPSVGWSEH